MKKLLIILISLSFVLLLFNSCATVNNKNDSVYDQEKSEYKKPHYIDFNTVTDNSLLQHEAYTWEDFFRETEIGDFSNLTPEFWCTHYENTFTTEFMTWISPSQIRMRKFGSRIFRANSCRLDSSSS